MGEIIAIANVKGGVGKSTMAAQLAGVMHDQGRSVMVYDTDPHATLTSWACGGPLAPLVVHEPLRSVKRIGEWVELVRHARDNHDFVILDLPSAPNSAITTGLMVAQKLLMPIGPTPGDMHGSDQTMKLLHLAKRSRQGAPQLLLVPSRTDSRGRMSANMHQFAENLAEAMAPAVAQRACFAESATKGMWVGRSKADLKAREEIEAVIRSIESLTDRAAMPDADLAAAIEPGAAVAQ